MMSFVEDQQKHLSGIRDTSDGVVLIARTGNDVVASMEGDM